MEPTDTARALVADLAEMLAASERPYPSRVIDDLLARAELLAAELTGLLDHVPAEVAADAVALCAEASSRCADGRPLATAVRTAA